MNIRPVNGGIDREGWARTQSRRGTMTQPHGARVNVLFDTPRVIYVAQTIKSGTEQNAPYVMNVALTGRTGNAL